MRYALAITIVLNVMIASGPAFAQIEYSEDREHCVHFDADRQPFFGTTHLHTGLSFDASIRYVDQALINPRTAYKFAKGDQTLLLPDAVGIPGGSIPGVPGPNRRVRNRRPQDWGAVTDHAEHFGEIGICKNKLDRLDPASVPGRLSMECRMLNGFYWGPSGASGIPPALSKFLTTTYATSAFQMLIMSNITPTTKMTTMPACLNNPSSCADAEMAVWEEVQNAAEHEYDRSSSCEFTTFVAYENTSSPSGTNWHRNVLFRNDKVVQKPITSIDMAVNRNLRPTSGGLGRVGEPPAYLGGIAGPDAYPVVPGRAVTHPLPEIFWNKLESDCIEGGSVTDSTSNADYCDMIIIPHNSNVGGGVPPLVPPQWFTPFNRVDAARKAKFEPLVEIYQDKGSSECRWDPRFANKDYVKPNKNSGDPSAGVQTVDEFCAFELLDSTSIGSASGIGMSNVLLPPDAFDPRSYVRNIWKDGLALSKDFGGVNPFKPGVVSSQDAHNGTMGWYPEDKTFTGHLGVEDVWPVQSPESIQNSSGGHSVVWAEENSRDAIFDALQRKETYGTSGTRIVVRFFGGWDYGSANEVCGGDIPEIGYGPGGPGSSPNHVPMGGDLVGRPAGAGNPRFILAAWKDDHPDGRNLQQIQIIKGWVDDKWETHEEVLTVVGRKGNALKPEKNVNKDTCTPQTTKSNGKPLGRESLCTVWEDPNFNPDESAFYYARVLEEPVCRYSTDWCQSWVGVDPFDLDQCQADLLDLAQSEDPIKRLRAVEGASCCSNLKTSPIVQTAIQERAWTSPIWYTPE